MMLSLFDVKKKLECLHDKISNVLWTHSSWPNEQLAQGHDLLVKTTFVPSFEVQMSFHYKVLMPASNICIIFFPVSLMMFQGYNTSEMSDYKQPLCQV